MRESLGTSRPCTGCRRNNASKGPFSCATCDNRQFGAVGSEPEVSLLHRTSQWSWRQGQALFVVQRMGGHKAPHVQTPPCEGRVARLVSGIRINCHSRGRQPSSNCNSRCDSRISSAVRARVRCLVSMPAATTTFRTAPSRQHFSCGCARTFGLKRLVIGRLHQGRVGYFAGSVRLLGRDNGFRTQTCGTCNRGSRRARGQDKRATRRTDRRATRCLTRRTNLQARTRANKRSDGRDCRRGSRRGTGSDTRRPRDRHGGRARWRDARRTSRNRFDWRVGRSRRGSRPSCQCVFSGPVGHDVFGAILAKHSWDANCVTVGSCTYQMRRTRSCDNSFSTRPDTVVARQFQQGVLVWGTLTLRLTSGTPVTLTFQIWTPDLDPDMDRTWARLPCALLHRVSVVTSVCEGAESDTRALGETHSHARKEALCEECILAMGHTSLVMPGCSCRGRNLLPPRM